MVDFKSLDKKYWIEHPDALAPILAAEDVPPHALAAMTRGKKIIRTSFLIEQSFHGDEEKLDEGLAIAEEVYATRARNEKLKAGLYLASGALFRARVRGELPDESQLLATRYAFSQQIRSHWTQLRGEQQYNWHHSNVAGVAAEAIVVQLGLDNALNQGTAPLYISSYREDNPPFEWLPAYFRAQMHDVHSYNPAEPSDRALINVKAAHLRGLSRGRLPLPFNIAGISKEVFQQIYGVSLAESEKLMLPEVAGLILTAEEPEAPESGNALRFRQELGARLQESIDAFSSLVLPLPAVRR